MIHHEQPPAILVITVDDCGNEFFGCYGEGPPTSQPRTDHIDMLAARGLRFDHYYSNPVCTPTRACILTGRYASRYGLGMALTEDDQEFLPRRENCFPELLPEVFCAHIGKWHLGDHWLALDPIVHGFDVHAGTPRSLGSYFSWERAVSWQWRQVWSDLSTYATAQVTDDALELLELAPQPMILWVCYHAPHSPLHDPPGYTTDGSDLARYVAMIEYLDLEIGRLLNALDLDRDFVILSSDNGSPYTVASTSGHKLQVLEGGVNVPLIIAGPGVATGATAALASSVDLFSTIVEIAGGVSDAQDGRSLLPVLTDPAVSVRDHVYVERFADEDGDGICEEDLRAAREARYKLTWDLDAEALYDLSIAPPGEDGRPLDLSHLTDEQRTAYERLHDIVLKRGR